MPQTLAGSLQTQFNQWKACVLIPTYNNAQTLADVVKSIYDYTTHILIVNDGSTDSTVDILYALQSQFPDIVTVSYPNNKGKGYALRTGFRKAYEMGYEYGIVIDSDGQHYPKDLHIFLDDLAKNGKGLVIGARNMSVANVPGKSTFGNRFSSFWYKIETGIKLPDTQSGYRLYPTSPLAQWTYFTNRYEFEIEVLVRAAWADIPVRSVDVEVYYPPKEERISHFRPFKDFTRISILNTVLVFLTFFYIKPKQFIQKLLSSQGRQQMWHLLFNDPSETPHTKALSIGFGVFMGIVPIWGFQLAVGIPLAIMMRLNKALFILAANISIFPPIFWLASIVCGKYLLGQHQWDYSLEALDLERLKTEGMAFFLGGTVLALVCGLLAYILTQVVIKIRRKVIRR